MDLTILGSGCGIPSVRHGSPGILIRISEESLLFDCGSGILGRLSRAGISYTSLKHVFFSHTHSDHSADLIPLVQSLKITPDFTRRESLNLYGPKNFSEFLNFLAQAYGNWVIKPEFPINVFELNKDVLSFDSFIIKTCPVTHSSSAIGFR